MVIRPIIVTNIDTNVSLVIWLFCYHQS